MAKNDQKFGPKIGVFGEFLEFLGVFGVVWGVLERSGVVWSILERLDEVEKC